ncbi:MAG: NAD-dependent malic enzyme [Candidatus Aminicenantes bacterium]|nr:NAD-dependent malic enzyme [Candidatus Aminicenantes bacterium]
MWWDGKIQRTFRCRLEQRPASLGELLSAIGRQGGLIGEIRTVHMGGSAVDRDITIYADDLKHLDRIVKTVEETPGAQLLEVRDEVLEMHQGGKIAIRSRYDISSLSTLRKVYTPGVAEVCLKIRDDPSLARRYTSIRHLVAIVTDGTAVLGLGDIGPKAAMPVMEGKASLLETLTGLSGMPILLDTKDPDEIVETVVHIAPTFAAIQLEDISAPRCFAIEERIQARLDIPVMHDDQHGTAVVVTATLLNAAKATGRDLGQSSIGVIGLGAAGMGLAKMLMFRFGHPVLGADIAPDALDRLKDAGGTPADLRGIMAGCDVVIATTGVPGLIKDGMVRKGQIILALSNPNPEIEPERALAAGAAYAADGKSVNNVLGFPGIWRGAVDANVPRITREMLIAAAEAIAAFAKPGEVVPDPLDKALHKAVARAVDRVALARGLNRDDLTGYFD